MSYRNLRMLGDEMNRLETEAETKTPEDKTNANEDDDLH